ncbi:MAG: 16S rRNA (cytosine(1402)-N(4))-methyltransferase RsmH [Bacteroidia bacterium]|nr:16S rRNA (cytosine(1402)-N(4))-methyltransferase RsmH [Bacteroidia bacterium]
MTKNNYHIPVLLQNCIEGLNIKPDGIYADVTYGGGGHSSEILKHLLTGKLIAFDQDEEAVNNKIEDDRIIPVKQNFRFLKKNLDLYSASPLDGILADLGVSSHQFDEPKRGFSTRFDSELDMRMNQGQRLTASEVLNTYEEDKLKKVFIEYGELENASRLARTLCTLRKSKPVETVNDLKEIANQFVRKGKENQYHAQLFQALRIEVNNELDALKELLMQSVDVLKSGGRLVVISYHSLEDRLVKNFMRSGKFEGDSERDFFGNPLVPFKVITRKPIMPGEKELEQNSRARSAKLRIAEKL